jgi:hypothetical protein
MVRLDRRSMLKMIAAAATGGAATLVNLPEVGAAKTIDSSSGVAAMPYAGGGLPPFTVFKELDGISDFAFQATTTWASGGVPGSIYPVDTTSNMLWGNLHLPDGVTLITLDVSVIVNDANPALWFFYRVNGPGGTSTLLANGSITSQGSSVFSVNLPIPNTTIHNSGNTYGLAYRFGTANSPSTHLFVGADLGYINAPGVTLFSAPQRVVGQAMTAGTTYGPFDATMTTTGGHTMVPAGAQAMLAAVQSYTPGVLTLYPDGSTDPGIANYSGTGTSGGSLNMLYVNVPLSSAGKFKIHSYLTGNVYVDAWGYIFQPG